MNLSSNEIILSNDSSEKHVLMAVRNVRHVPSMHCECWPEPDRFYSKPRIFKHHPFIEELRDR